MKLSQAELDTMLALWECDKPIRPSQLLKKMEATHPWSISTLKTILTRLDEKGAITVTCQKRFHYCFPKYTKEAYFALESQTLIERLNTSSPVTLMAGLLNNESLSEQDIDEIEQLVKRAKQRLLEKAK